MKNAETAQTTTNHADGLATDLGYKTDIMKAVHQEINIHTEPYAGAITNG